MAPSEKSCRNFNKIILTGYWGKSDRLQSAYRHWLRVSGYMKMSSEGGAY